MMDCWLDMANDLLEMIDDPRVCKTGEDQVTMLARALGSLWYRAQEIQIDPDATVH